MTRGRRGATVLALLGLLLPVRAEAVSAEERLRILEEQLRAAQEEIRQLRREVEAQRQKPDAAASTPAPTPPAAAEALPPLWRPPAWLERVTLLADVRFRVEGFYNRPDEEGSKVPSRTRERIRARIGLAYTHSDELAATIRLATGDPDDPISHNVTLNSLFDPKEINLNLAYLQFTPGATFGWRPGILTVQAGKFPLPLFRVGELVLDEDLAPEGFSQKIALLSRRTGMLERLDLHLLEWVFREVSDATDGWMIGGQIAPKLQIGPALVEAGVGHLWWYNADLIAKELERNAALENTNLLVTAAVDGDTEVVGYRSEFNLTTLTVLATVPELVLGQPLRLGLDWVYNWGAATDDNFGVQGMVRLGTAKKRGDWAATLLYQYLQQEAALSTFTWSDFGDGGTNVMGPVVSLEYQLLDPLTVRGQTYFVNRILKPAGVSNATLVRMQLDAMLRW